MEPNDFELAKNILLRIARTFGHIHHYSWDANFCTEQVIELADSIKKLDGYKTIEPYWMTAEQLRLLGFNMWDEDGPMLIPLWIVPFLDPEMKVKAIDGEEVRLADADTDERFGCIAYGLIGYQS